MTLLRAVTAYGARCFAALALLSSATASAQGVAGDGAQPPNAGAVPLYDALVDQGLAAFEQERWAEAYQLFDRAHALEPNARTLRARGIASYRRGELVNALADLRGSLGDPRRPLTPELVLAVQELVTRIEGQLGRLRVHVRPADALIRVDGVAAIPTAEGDLFVSPGPHRLELSADDHGPFERDLLVTQGGVTDLVVELAVLASGAVPSAIEPARSPDRPALAPGAISAPPAASAPSPAPSTAPLWISGGATAGFAIGAAAFWLAGNGEVEDVGDDCRARRCTPLQRERAIDASAIATYETFATGSLLLSGASLVAFGAAWVWFTGQAGHDTRTDAVHARPRQLEVRF